MQPVRSRRAASATTFGAVRAVGVLVAAVVALAPSRPASSSSHMLGHITIERPGELTGSEALEVYRSLAAKMAAGYRQAGFGDLDDYQGWRRYNTAPYLSSTHGNRYLNNYANDLAAGAGYERVGEGEGVAMPPGAIIAKDSFSVTDDDRIFPAPLFVMEKLGSGASPRTGDWRYLTILPDGTVFADSAGPSRGQAMFCHDCHSAAAETDFLYFVPFEVRVNE